MGLRVGLKFQSCLLPLITFRKKFVALFLTIVLRFVVLSALLWQWYCRPNGRVIKRGCLGLFLRKLILGSDSHSRSARPDLIALYRFHVDFVLFRFMNEILVQFEQAYEDICVKQTEALVTPLEIWKWSVMKRLITMCYDVISISYLISSHPISSIGSADHSFTVIDTYDCDCYSSIHQQLHNYNGGSYRPGR